MKIMLAGQENKVHRVTSNNAGFQLRIPEASPDERAVIYFLITLFKRRLSFALIAE